MDPDTIRRLIRASAAQQEAAVDAGDIELAEHFARAVPILLDEELHAASYWRTDQDARQDTRQDTADRQRRIFAAIERSVTPDLAPTPFYGGTAI